jgi:hypothetical protein
MTKYEQISKTVIAALDPELKRHVRKIRGSYWIHCPLLIKFNITAYGAAALNEWYNRKKIIAAELLADVRFKPMSYLWLIEKPYRLQAFIGIQDKLSDAQYWRNLEFAWEVNEFVHRDKTTWLSLFTSKRRYRGLIMDREDRKHLQTLPDELVIYRGYRHSSYKAGLSWTLSLEKAAWFANRWNQGNPMVVTGRCRKEDVIAYLNGRNEQEIVIDPRKVTGLKKLKDFPARDSDEAAT